MAPAIQTLERLDKVLHQSLVVTENNVLDDDRADILKDRFTRDQKYEHRTRDKIRIYLDYIEPEFDEGEINELIREAYRTRNEVAHEFGEDRLQENMELTFKLQKVLVFIIFDLLEISGGLQQAMLLTLHDEPGISYDGGDVVH